ncbi:S8 family serine peptidase [Streptomyces tanashiensis]|uniref:S8 family serine peptidase n=1 Tax=Streptomyces tanashiensis TaxID=67367 RepID=UPI003408E27C
MAELKIKAPQAEFGLRPPPMEPEYTGGFIVLLDEENLNAGISALKSAAGVSDAVHIDSHDAPHVANSPPNSDAIIFDEMAVAIVDVEPDQTEAICASKDLRRGILAVERETYFYASAETDYFRGYRDGVSDTLARYFEKRADHIEPTAVEGPKVSWDEADATWGVQAVLATESRRTGAGVGIAILDTGIHRHQDFAGRILRDVSFIPGESVDDGNGHGTHCAGTACGPQSPDSAPRYGVAPDAYILAGKVLDNRDGRAQGRSVIAGIVWVTAEKECRVISMSFSSPPASEGYSVALEALARRAVTKGKLLVAAAGNTSRRPYLVQPVRSPANCPSILAVAAVTPNLGVADFSCAGSAYPRGGGVDLAAPGVDVLSTSPSGNGYVVGSGTSMATPHVAGVASLLFEENPQATPAQIADLLRLRCHPLAISSQDVGRGLVQAP